MLLSLLDQQQLHGLGAGEKDRMQAPPRPTESAPAAAALVMLSPITIGDTLLQALAKGEKVCWRVHMPQGST